MKTIQAEKCSDCHNNIIPTMDCTPGYAVLPDGLHICYSCADKRQIEQLKNRSQPFTAYLSGDGKSITTWTGGELMRVTRSNTARLTRWSHTHGKTIQCIHAVDVHGGHWFGRRGNPNIVIHLRPCKSE